MIPPKNFLKSKHCIETVLNGLQVLAGCLDGWCRRLWADRRPPWADGELKPDTLIDLSMGDALLDSLGISLL